MGCLTLWKTAIAALALANEVLIAIILSMIGVQSGQRRGLD
jgi:hypothetical protein